MLNIDQLAADLNEAIAIQPLSNDSLALVATIRTLIDELRAWRELYPGETPEQAAEHYVS
jgi:hypothetical protein